MDTIAIIHNQNKSKHLSDSLKDIPHMKWETCLRELIFLSKHDCRRLEANTPILYDQDAYSELLEIICGLQSPVLGETQVFGQFKNFLKQQSDENHPLLQKNWPYFQNLLSEAKMIREANRGRLNSAGYGSITRKILKGKGNVAILGSGELAGEIFSLIQKNTDCTVYSRNISKDFFGQNPKPYSELASHHDAIIIAAPIENCHFLDQVRSSTLIVDWRAEYSIQPQSPHQSYFGIKDLFRIHEQEKITCQKIAESIRKTIRERTLAYFERVNIRPLGWEDVCA